MKTSELSGPALDWAVAKCEGKIDRCGEVTRIGNQLFCYEDGERMRYAPSTEWSQGGPIIEREELSGLKCYSTHEWECNNGPIFCEGPTPLIAAMRCFVASKLGDEVEVPNELIGE